MEMTKKQEKQAISWAKESIQKKFTQMFGFAPSKRDIIPLEVGYHYDKELDMWFCDSLGFHVGGIGYGYNMAQVSRNDAYDLKEDN